MSLAAVPVVKIHPEWKWDGDAPLVPQIEEEVSVPEPLDHYSVAPAKAKIEKQAPRRPRYVACRPNFFERLLVSFINLQKHQPAKTAVKRSHTTSRAAERGKSDRRHDDHRDDGKRFVVRADEKLTAFWQLESMIRAVTL